MTQCIAVTASYPSMDKVRKFLLKQGIHEELVNTKLDSLLSNPNEQAFILAFNQQKLVGLAEIMVQYKLTRTLSKACHIDNIIISSQLNKEQQGQIHIQLEKFTVSYTNQVLGCYKTFYNLSEKERDGSLEFHEKAGLTKKLEYMEIGGPGIAKL